MKFSVLMAVYEKENPYFLSEAIESTLINQSVIPNEFVIVKDGSLTKQLDDVIGKYKKMFPSVVKVIQLDINKGLGEALRIGLENCSFDIIARMDSDDINHYLRFEKQLKVFKENPEIDLVGANIAEFFDTPDEIKFIRKVPINNFEIEKMAKRRNPINHVSVMFKKSAVINSGSYKHLYFLEDYYLWVRMLAKGYKLLNVNETLVYVRTGEKMFKRRSNPVYIKSWFYLQRKMLEYRLINEFDLVINMFNIITFIHTPYKLKKYLYRWFLRTEANKKGNVNI